MNCRHPALLFFYPGPTRSQAVQRTEGKEGRYYQGSYTLDMKSHADYVKKDFVENVRQQIDDYKKFRDLIKK